jgi:hypothetical protein
MPPDAPTRERLGKPKGSPTERVTVEAPAVQRLSHAELTDVASDLAKKPVTPTPKAVMELSARQPYDAEHGNVDVFMPGRWETTYGEPGGLIFMEAIRLGEDLGEWEGTVAYIKFKPPSNATYLIVGHFTGYQITMRLHGPWGEATAYTATTSDSGAVTALWTGDKPFEFTMNCGAPNNDWGMGYIESIQVFHLA